MSWTHMSCGTMLTHNRDGTQKPHPIFWTPPRAQFVIPDLEHRHGRPCVRFHNEADSYPLTLMIFPDRIGGIYHNDRRTLVALGDAPSDPQHWAGSA